MSEHVDPFAEPPSEPDRPEPDEPLSEPPPEPPGSPLRPGSAPDENDCLTAYGISQPAGARPTGEHNSFGELWTLPGCDLPQPAGAFCWKCKRRHAYLKEYDRLLTHEQAVARHGPPPEGLRPRPEPAPRTGSEDGVPEPSMLEQRFGPPKPQGR